MLNRPFPSRASLIAYAYRRPILLVLLPSSCVLRLASHLARRNRQASTVNEPVSACQASDLTTPTRRRCARSPLHSLVPGILGDGGRHPSSFLVRPSQRTKAMVNAGYAARYADLPYLLERDPGGVARAIESYESVGLQMFKRPKRFRRAEVMEQNFLSMVVIFFIVAFLLIGIQQMEPIYERSAFAKWWREWTARK